MKNSLDDIFKGLKSGEIDLYQSTPYSVIYYMEQNFIDDIGILGNDFIFTGDHTTSHRIAMSKENPMLASILSKAMAAVTDEEFNEIANRWLDGFLQRGAVELTEEEEQWLIEHPTIKIADEPDLAPLVFRGENGEVRGISVDFFEIIEDKLGVEFVWILKDTFSDAVSDLETGRADIIPAINPTPERKGTVFGNGPGD